MLLIDTSELVLAFLCIQPSRLFQEKEIHLLQEQNNTDAFTANLHKHRYFWDAPTYLRHHDGYRWLGTKQDIAVKHELYHAPNISSYGD